MKEHLLKIEYEIAPGRGQVSTWVDNGTFSFEYVCSICKFEIIKTLPKKLLTDNPHSYETAFTLSVEEQEKCPHIFHVREKELDKEFKVSINQITTCLEALRKKSHCQQGIRI